MGTRLTNADTVEAGRLAVEIDRRFVLALMRRPWLGLEAARAWWSMRSRSGGGVSHSYLNWRLATAYGDVDATMSGQELLDYLAWRRSMRVLRQVGEQG